jgi:hypothetical protein
MVKYASKHIKLLKMKRFCHILLTSLICALQLKGSVFIVTSNQNGGAGSLRTAITNANNSIGRDTIYFNLGPSVAARTITLTSALPNINDTLLIDGTSNAGNPFGNSEAKIILRSNGTSMNGLRIQADGSEIYGLVLTNFGNGIYFAVTDTIKDVRIGSPGKGNVIGGNNGGGITGFDGRNIIIQSNFIGLDTSGTQVNANTGAGIGFTSTLFNSLIGGYGPGEGNVVSASGLSGIYQAGGDSLSVIGNRVGTSWDGTQLIGNTGTGIYIGSIGQNKDLIIENNIVCGADIGGIRIDAYRGIVRNNKIGTDISGELDFGNDGFYGLMVDGDANLIHGNTISGNLNDGIAVNQFSDSCLITGNKIGTSADGLLPLGNEGFGITINGSNCTIGGIADSLRNIIGDNLTGIEVSGENCKIIGNYIGIGIDGETPLGNNAFGIFTANADSFIINRNIIACNFARGIQLNSGSGKILGNIIGTRADSTEASVSQLRGIEVWSPVRVQIGGAEGEGNFISGNSDAGIYLSAAQSCSIENNSIGSESIGNGGDGIKLSGGCRFIQIGKAGLENLIQQNGGYGISVSAASDSVSLQFNLLRCNGQILGEGGIEMEPGANSGITAPNLFLAGNLVQGSATSGHRVDVYASDNTCSGCEGWFHIAHTTANLENYWILEIPQSFERILAIASDTIAKRSSAYSDCAQTPVSTQFPFHTQHIYPNPFTEYINIDDCSDNDKISIYDLRGHLVYEQFTLETSTILQLGAIDNGIYFLKKGNSVEMITKCK